ncbi:MAG: LamG domain-containing protein [Deltaproteobacteria bacterium]|nr:LamG domain-containing protein [Deltaproteobacteria bacterium]
MERKQTRLTLLVLFTMILATACSGGTSSQKNPVNQPVAHSGIALPAYLTGLNESDISARLEVYNSIGELIHSEELEINNTSVSSGNFDLDNNGLYTFVVAFYTTSGDTEVALCYALINKTVTAKNPSISFSEEDVIYQNNSSGEFISSSINLGLYSVPNLDRDGDGVSNLFEIIEGNDPLVANQTDNNDDTDTGSDEEVDPDAVSIESFKATRTAIQSGETTTLSWKASNYNSLNITPDVGDVTDLTSIALFPSKTTTYVLLATKDEQSSSAEVTISVNHSPVFVKHLTSQALHNAAEGSLLSWSSSDSDSDTVTATIKFYDTKTCTCDNAANCFESNTTDSEYMVDGLSVLKDYSYSLSLDDGKGGSDESPCFAFTTGIDQLAAWWRFDDEGESETADVSENANTLTLAATSGDLPVYSSGIKGQAIELSGTNYLGAVDNDSLDLGTSDFTLSFFFLAPEESSDHTIFYKKGGSANAAGFEVYQSNDNDGMRSRIANGTNNIAITSSHSDLDDNNWHHVVITRQDQQYSTYIDGQLSNQYSFLESMNLDNSNNLTIGSNGSNYFQGSLDEIVLTKSAMSAAQVLALCEEGLGSTSCGAKNNQPTALSPIHGWTYQYNRVNLTWQESSDGASYYEVCWQRATTNPFADEETMTCENSASTTEPYVTLDEDQLRLPETSDTYWWHVRACSIGSDDSISCSSYSEPRSFKIQNKLQAWWRFDSKTEACFDLSDFNNDGFHR